MTTLRTDLGNTRESARRIRVEPTGSITQTNVQKALEQISTQPQGIVSTSVAATPYTVLSTDLVLYVDTSIGVVTINLQAASARNSVPLVIKDITGHGLANPISLVPDGAETIDGLAPYPITGDFAGVKLNPRSGTGYTVAP